MQPLFAAVVLAMIVTPIAIAGAKSPKGKSSSQAVLKQVKALKRQTAALSGQLAGLQAKLAALEGGKQGGQSSPPGGPAGGVLTGSYPNPQLRGNTVSSSSILDGSITGEDIAQKTIQGGNIAPNTIQGANLANEAIGQAKLGSAAVGGHQLGAAEVVKSGPNPIGGNAAGGNDAVCPPGERLIGGGAEWGEMNTNLFVISSVPDTAHPENQWDVLGRNSSGKTDSLFAYALCLK